MSKSRRILLSFSFLLAWIGIANAAEPTLREGEFIEFKNKESFACVEAKIFLEASAYLRKHDRVAFDKLFHRDPAHCIDFLPSNVRYFVDGVDEHDGVNLVEFHTTSSFMNDRHLYAPPSAVRSLPARMQSIHGKVWENHRLIPGFRFTIGNNGSFACAKKDDLAAFVKYKANGGEIRDSGLPYENGGHARCFSASLTKILFVLDDVEQVKGIRSDVVKFHRFDSDDPMPLYAPIEFVSDDDAPGIDTTKMRDAKDAKITPGVHFSIPSPPGFFACESKDDLAKFIKYNMTDQFPSMPAYYKGKDKFGNYYYADGVGRSDIDFCFGNNLLSSVTMYQVDEIKKDDGIAQDVVAFHRMDTPKLNLYTTLKNIREMAQVPKYSYSPSRENK